MVEKRFMSNEKDTYYEYPIMGEIVSNDTASTFVEKNPAEYTMDGHTVFVLGGNMTADENSANRQGMIVDNFLKLLYKKAENKDGTPVRDDIHILSFAYGIVDEEDLYGRFTKGTQKAIADRLLMQKCTDEAGNRLDIDSACKGLSQISFFTYCHGAVEVNKIIECFQESLKGKGYSPEEITKMLDCMGQVSFAPEYGAMSLIPTIRFDSRQDYSMGNYRRLLLMSEGILKDYEGIEFRHFPRGKFWEYERADAAETINVFSEKLLNAFDNSIDEHSLGYLKRNASWEWIVRNRDGLPQRPYKDDIYKYSPNADAMSQIMGWAISRLVHSGIENIHSDKYVPRVPFTEILNEMQSIKGDFSPESLL